MPSEAREFTARLIDWKEIHSLPNSWPTSRLMTLLDKLEIDGVAESEAFDMTIFALQDLEWDEAAEHVLEAVFGGAMRSGVRQNLARDLDEDRPWEDFAELSQQAGIFEAVQLLQQAFPSRFGTPDAVSIAVQIETSSKTGQEWLDESLPNAGLLLRILCAGMGDRAIARRLFSDALAGPRFPQASSILWHLERRSADGPTCELAMISSHQWFDPLEDLESWTARAWPDEATP